GTKTRSYLRGLVSGSPEDASLPSVSMMHHGCTGRSRCLAQVSENRGNIDFSFVSGCSVCGNVEGLRMWESDWIAVGTDEPSSIQFLDSSAQLRCEIERVIRNDVEV